MKAITIAVVIAAAVVGSASANGGNDKVKICHKGKTITVSKNAVKGHLGHGDKLGSCSTSQPNPPADDGNITVTPGTFTQVNRILACADRPVIRTADNTFGIAVDLDLATFTSGLYEGVKFTVARYYVTIGATCDNLGGQYTNRILNGYPVWSNLRV